MTQAPEVWLRGPVDGVSPQLQPVAHALVQAVEDVERFIAGIESDALWSSAGGAATIGFHLRHMSGSLDRLMTYARGEPLDAEQKARLAAEKDVTPAVSGTELLDELRATVERALRQLRSTPDAMLDEPRAVGRAGHPSSVRGLLHHAGEHTARHAGQISTTAKIVRGIGPSGR